MVGLGNVNNTSDASKPVSTATQTALNLKAQLASPALTGTATAVTINATGTITASIINASTTLQYGGVDIDTISQPRLWVLGAIDGATGNVNVTSGKGILSCTRSSTGTYGLTWTTAPSTPSCVFLQIRVANGFIQYSGLGTSGMTVRSYNTNVVLTDNSYSVMIYL